jgi:hypothetical protein
VDGEPVITGGLGVSEKTGSLDGEWHPVKMTPVNSRPQAIDPKLDAFQNNFIVSNPYETGRTINIFV